MPTGTAMPRLSGPGGGVIAYVSSVRDDRELYLMNADGSGKQRLTRQAGDDDWPAWSPDGTQLAFMHRPGGNWDLYVIQADGTDCRPLTATGALEGKQAWRPDPAALHPAAVAYPPYSDPARVQRRTLDGCRNDRDHPCELHGVAHGPMPSCNFGLEHTPVSLAARTAAPDTSYLASLGSPRFR